MSSSLGPDERRRRRALLKAHHPDLGGDVEEFIRATTAFGAGAGDEVRFVRRPRGLARITAWCTKSKRFTRRSGPPRVL